MRLGRELSVEEKAQKFDETLAFILSEHNLDSKTRKERYKTDYHSCSEYIGYQLTHRFFNEGILKTGQEGKFA